MTTPLCTSDDVSTLLLRPLTANEQTYIGGLIAKASSLLRNAVPSIDVRMGRYVSNPGDPGGVDPVTVATVLAGVIKRYMRNPDGVASATEGAGPFSTTTSYALRGDKAPRGVLEISAEDISALFPNRKRPRAGTIRTRPALAPRPVGRYGPLPGPDQVISAVVEWNEYPVAASAEVVELGAYGPDGSTS